MGGSGGGEVGVALRGGWLDVELVNVGDVVGAKSGNGLGGASSETAVR